MTKLIIGLGNPEKEYSGTRHNIGFEIVDKLKEGFSARGGPAIDWEFNKKFNAEISKGFVPLLPIQREGGPTLEGPDEGKQEIILVKPQAFMNLSGETIRKILEFYKLTPDDIIVVHDDLDIALGKFKIATDSSSAGHNGIQNIIETIGTQKFKRVRIGIGPETGELLSLRDAHLPSRSPAEAGDYVLGKFSEEEREKIKKIEDPIMIEIEKFYK